MLRNMHGSFVRKWLATLSLVGFGLGISASAYALGGDANTPDCGIGGADCRFTVGFNGQTIGAGKYDIDSEGQLVLLADAQFNAPDGSFMRVTDVRGSADPVLGFSAEAGTGARGGAFVFNFELPISLSGKVDASSTIGYSLTALTANGARISPLIPGSKVMIAQDVDTSVGGLPPIPKGVNAGETFAIAPGNLVPTTVQSQTYTAANQFNTNSAYDTMQVVVAFGLSPQSTVGLSGSVTQVPEPASYLLLAAGLVAVGGFVRRRSVD